MKRTKRILSGTVAAAILLGATAILYPTAQFSAKADSTMLSDHYKFSREAAADGMVLLKNDGSVLPLQGTDSKVAVFGMNQLDYVAGGGGSAYVNAPYAVNLMQGLKNDGVTAYAPLAQAYSSQFPTKLSQYSGSDSRGKVGQIDISSYLDGAKAYTDTAIISIGRNEQEGTDMQINPPTSGSDQNTGYYLTADEQSMVNTVCANFSKVIVVLNVPAVIDSTWFKGNDKIQAVLMAWMPGMEGGDAIADVLTGAVNPSGRLADTMAESYIDYPSSKTFDNTDYQNYYEDIYTGYRYFETIPGMESKVNYHFGFGLSYTTFAVSNQTMSVKDETVTVKADVKNTGTVSGKEVLETYYSAPQGKLGKPARELAAFAKTDLLAPGASQTLTMSFNVSDMASYDDLDKTSFGGSWVLEAGDYKVYVGTTVAQSDLTQAGTYTVAADIKVGNSSHLCTPTLLEGRLNAAGTVETTHEIASNNRTRIDASEFASTNGAQVESQGDVGYFNNGASVTYTVDAPYAGTYKLGLSTGRGDDLSPAQNAVGLTVNGTAVSNVNITVPNSGWYTYADTTGTYINLNKGSNTLTITNIAQDSRSTAYNLMYLYVTPVFDIAATGQSVIPACAFSVKDPSVTVDNVGTVGNTQAGRYICYDVNVAEAGTYDVKALFASGLTTNSGWLAISVDGTAEGTVNQAFTSGDWGKYIPFTFQITLPQGVHMITLKNNDGGVNMESFTFSKAAASTTSEVKTAARHTTLSSGGTIMLADVYNGKASMSDFLAQLSIDQLSQDAQGQTGGGYDVGGFGFWLPQFGALTANADDGPAGIHVGGELKATWWPCATLLACTWDVNLVQKTRAAEADEASAYDIDILLAPSMNIHRDPRDGRNFEYFSEDPVLSGEMGAASVEGIQSEGIGATIKHFAANNKEDNRRGVDSRISERALREIYLKGFQIAIEKANPWCLMDSYNPLNGIKVTANKELLTGILRGEWNYKGMVMTDWDTSANHVMEFTAGSNVKMPQGDPDSIAAIANDANDGRITRADLEANAAYVLNLVMKTKKWQNDYISKASTDINNGTVLLTAYDTRSLSNFIVPRTTGDSALGYRMGLKECRAGESVTYDINVTQAGAYSVTPRLCSVNGGGAFDIYIDNVKTASYTNKNKTKSSSIYVDASTLTLTLPAGKHTMSIAFTQGDTQSNCETNGGKGMDLEALTFTLKEASQPSSSESSSSQSSSSQSSSQVSSSQPGSSSTSSVSSVQISDGSSEQTQSSPVESSAISGTGRVTTQNPGTGDAFPIPVAAAAASLILGGAVASVRLKCRTK